MKGIINHQGCEQKPQNPKTPKPHGSRYGLRDLEKENGYAIKIFGCLNSFFS